MKKIVRNYFSVLLVIGASVFLVVVVGSFMWGIGYIVTEVGRATNSQVSKPNAPAFDLSGAASLDYKGLLP
jgi:hypothetical protein